MAPNYVNNQSIADANTTPTEGHTTVAEPHTMAAEPYTMAAEPHTMAAERCKFSSSSLPEGHTKATRWLHDVLLRLRTKTRRSRDGKKHMADYDRL